MTLFALLELYKAGEASWEQEVPFGPITVRAQRSERAGPRSSRRCCSSRPSRCRWSALADACEVSEGEVVEALARLREHYAEGYRGVVLREVAGGFTLATDPVAERAARRLLAKPRTPPLTQAQAECLAIVAYLQPVSRPEIARIRGVASESAVGTLLERGLIEESGRSRFGAVLYRTTELFEKLFGLAALDALPDPPRSTPRPRRRASCASACCAAGEQRAAGQPPRAFPCPASGSSGRRSSAGAASPAASGSGRRHRPHLRRRPRPRRHARPCSTRSTRPTRESHLLHRRRAGCSCTDALAREVAERGHDVALHGYEHVEHDELGGQREDDLARGLGALEVGHGPPAAALFRPPYGRFSEASYEACDALELSPSTGRRGGWTGSRCRPTASPTSRRATSSDGAILLLHDSARYATATSARRRPPRRCPRSSRPQASAACG